MSQGIWATLALNVGALLVAFLIRGASLAPGLLQTAAPSLLVLAAAPVLRARGWRRLANVLTAFGQMTLLALVSMALAYLLAGSALPLRDAELMAADRALGIEWRALLAAFMRWPALMTMMNVAYASMGYLIVLAPLLFLVGDGQRPAAFVLAWALALSVTTAIFPFVPALGGFLHLAIERTDVPQVLVGASWQYADAFYRARAGADLLVDAADLDGLITFPSFHAQVAILLAWAAWPVRALRWPALFWNGLMWVSSIPIGAHYCVDLLAGSAVALACIAAAQAISQPKLRDLAPEPAYLRAR